MKGHDVPRRKSTEQKDSPVLALSPQPGKEGSDSNNALTKPTSLPDTLIVPAESVLTPTIDQPMSQIKDIVGPSSAANIQIQEQTTISHDQVSNTRTLSIEIPAKKTLPDVKVPMLILILSIAAIVGTVVVLIL